MGNHLADELDPRFIRLHFAGPAAKEHTVPAQALVRALSHIQRAIFLIAKMEHGRELGLRTRVSHEDEHLFALMCKLPERGGYTIPAEIGNPKERLFDPAIMHSVATKFKEIATAAGSGDGDQFRSLIPDRNYRAGLLKALKESQPPARSGLNLSLEDVAGAPFVRGPEARIAFASLEAQPSKDHGYVPGYVAGTLVEMKFEDRQFGLKLASGRQIQAIYAEHYENILTDHPRDLIQVFGNVTYDDQGKVKSIVDVSDILEVDVSDIQINEFSVDGEKYNLSDEWHFTVIFDEADGLYQLEGPHDILLASETRSELEEALEAEIELLWREYGCARDDELSPKAQQLAETLRKQFQKVNNA